MEKMKGHKRKRGDSGSEREQEQWTPYGFPFQLLFKYGTPKSILRLASCSTEMIRHLAPIISSEYRFKYSRGFTWYAPKRVVYVEELLPIQWEEHITDLKFVEVAPPIDKNCLPKNISRLTLSPSYNHPTDNLPTTITYLHFGDDFNHSVDNLPPHLTTLKFGNSFNQTVNKLPSTLIKLSFGKEFNKPVENVPPTLTHLSFDEEFNQSINKLPPSVSHLTFGYRFDQSIANLPPKLVQLTFDTSDFNQPLPVLPPTLTTLELGVMFNHSVDNLPASLTHLSLLGEFDQSVDKLPASLKYLELGSCFSCSLDKLPHSLTHLIFEDEIACFFDQPIDKLPTTLTHLTIFASFDKSLDNLPNALTHFIIKDMDEIYDDNLDFTKQFNKPINRLPISLVCLELNHAFNQPIGNFRELENLTHLKFGNDFAQIIHELPPKLIYLVLGTHFADANCLKELPESLHEFHIRRYLVEADTSSTTLVPLMEDDFKGRSTLIVRAKTAFDKSRVAVHITCYGGPREVVDLAFLGSFETEERFLLPTTAEWLPDLMEFLDERIVFWALKKFQMSDILLKDIEWQSSGITTH